MKVKIIKEYYDSTKNNELIKVGAELSVSTERGNTLISAGVGKEIKEVKTTKKK